MKSKKEKWHSRLTIWVISILLFELLSGLIIYVASFSLTTQALVVIHTALGLAVVIPYIIYQARHWHSYRKNKITQHFGLAKFKKIDTLNIQWPSGLNQQFLNIPANQRLEITEGENKIN